MIAQLMSAKVVMLKVYTKKARNGEISHFTGISSPYEPPDKPELCVNTAKLSIEESVDVVLQMLESRC